MDQKPNLFAVSIKVRNKLDEFLSAVEAADEDVGGHRVIGEIIKELGPLYEELCEVLVLDFPVTEEAVAQAEDAPCPLCKTPRPDPRLHAFLFSLMRRLKHESPETLNALLLEEVLPMADMDTGVTGVDLTVDPIMAEAARRVARAIEGPWK